MLRENETLVFYASLLEAIYEDRKAGGLADNLDGQMALQEGAKALRKVSLFREEIEKLGVISDEEIQKWCEKIVTPKVITLNDKLKEFAQAQLQDCKDTLLRMME
ncbi:MAG: hypothetical protein MUP17_10120 [candidate division Zixibacteria bacterium]|nr:hypothetical protein [candidate division Zixibacteria bacterium]